MQVGADDEGYAVRMKLKHYLEYVHSAEHARADDSPLYIFDGTFASRRGSRSMRKEYSVPSYFREDLMGLAGEKRRPPYRFSESIILHSHSCIQTLKEKCWSSARALYTTHLWRRRMHMAAPSGMS